MTKCLLTLEWNNNQFDVLSRRYSSLVKSDVTQAVSFRKLPDSLNAACLLLVDISSQSLGVINSGKLQDIYKVSTAANGAGCREGSGCTPLGWHSVAQKIGDHEPAGTVFKGRRKVGLAESLSSIHDDDLITSRIIWLSGLQPGVNAGGSVDSYSRYIYIHGTAQEHRVGQAVSHGCVRMCNQDIIKLFNCIDERTIVLLCHNVDEYCAAL